MFDASAPYEEALTKHKVGKAEEQLVALKKNTMQPNSTQTGID